MNVRYRVAGLADASAIAPMNAQLIRDEGHRNAMTVPQLAERMTDWLRAEYQACLSDMRRRGIARRALEWLRQNAWGVRPRVRIDVLVGNHTGIEFWRSVGFTDYCLTTERPV
jgi:GNAT superfamily N-acetyltransferase